MIKILIRQVIINETTVSKKEQARLLSAAGKELLALGAARWYGVHWDSEEEKQEQLATERNPWGKPTLIHHPQIHFNISHSGHLAACGFGAAPLGLDIQQRLQADYLRIARRYYTKADQTSLLQAGEDQRKELFYKIWTKEESYAKWLGTALPQTIGTENKTGFCHYFEPHPGYQAAVWTSQQEELEIKIINHV